MPAETNLIKADNLGAKIKDIDFVNRFGQSVEALVEMLGISAKIPLMQESKIQTYTYKTTVAGGTVAEGETIPLSLVEKNLGPAYTVALEKYRKAVSAEAVLRHGIALAEDKTEKELLRALLKKVRDKFFTFLAAAPTKQTAPTLQKAIAIGGAKATSFFEDSVDIVTLVNPMDVAEWVGEKNIAATSSSAFGFTLLKDFVGAERVLSFNNVPQGKVYSTAAENLNFCYYDMAASDLAKSFELVTDGSGNYIGIHRGEPRTDNATKEILIMTGATLFAEVLDAVVETTIEAVPEG